MAKKAHVLDLVTRAKANGYKRGAHKEQDQIRHQQKHVKKTVKDQDATMKRYVLWHLAEMQDTARSQQIKLPTEDEARLQCLRTGVVAPDLTTVKDFLRFYIATSRPQLSTVPTVDSINTVAEWFFAGFTRITGTETNEGDRKEVYNWVRKVLTIEGIVVNKRRPKHNLTEKDVKRIQLAPWIKDDLIFIPERYRVQVLWAVNEFCNSGARLGAFFTNGVRWRDIDLVLQRGTGYIYNLKQRWVKGNRDPENIVFGIAGRSYNKLLHNTVGLLIIMAIADSALVGYETLQDLQEQRIPAGENEVILRFKDSMLDQPILRKCTMSGGITNEPMPRDAFVAIFNAIIRSAGYTCAASIHAIRRQLGKKVDELYTEVQRAQHLTQGDLRVFGQSYVANTSSVDGQAAYLGEPSDHRHIEFFQGMGRFYEEGLPCRLPAQREDEVQRDPRILQLEKAARAAVFQGPDSAKTAKAKLASQRKTLMRIALQQYQGEWIQERRDWKVATRGKERNEGSTRDQNNFVHSLFRLFPERDRLAQIMVADRPLKPEEMWRAMDDLLTLCRRDTSVLYLPGHQPVSGRYPVKCCQLGLETCVSLPSFACT